MAPLNLVKLAALMEVSSGRPQTVIGLIDGPVDMSHPDLAAENMREIPGRFTGTCAEGNSAACMHGTFVAGILFGKRKSQAPAICPDCTVLVRPIFSEEAPRTGLGDVLKKVSYALHIKPCPGCEGRAASLNRWIVFTGRRR